MLPQFRLLCVAGNLETFIRSFLHFESNLATSTNFIYMRMQSQMKNKIARKKMKLYENEINIFEKLIINCMQLQPCLVEQLFERNSRSTTTTWVRARHMHITRFVWQSEESKSSGEK